ncbi:hypothetical protein Q9251_06885 [Alkalihalobacillus macyae]|uniref:hypothetical protein n=1 Tax=Guptibacillus hwajinpoensis TaxID=208199 RepID=UPI00273B50BE|nr:hypothetical protein [Alkalihalobacillus macyae]MDP4550603.1 hypothetical protein [Alkalihalobacillus macyae]
MKKLDRKWIHIINIILGVIIVPYSILELIGVFLLTDNKLYALVPIGLLLVWLVLYIIQVKTQKTLLVMIAVFLNIFYIFFIIPKMLY